MRKTGIKNDLKAYNELLRYSFAVFVSLTGEETLLAHHFLYQGQMPLSTETIHVHLISISTLSIHLIRKLKSGHKMYVCVCMFAKVVYNLPASLLTLFIDRCVRCSTGNNIQLPQPLEHTFCVDNES